MKFDKNTLRLLGLSSNETKILGSIYDSKETPLQIANTTKISRPTIYDTLEKLHHRGLIRSTIRNGKKYWVPAKNIELDKRLFEVKKTLFSFDEGVEEVRTQSDSTVIVHRGGEAVRTLIRSIFKDNKNVRLYGIQGDLVNIGWTKVFGVEGTNELNRWVKQNQIIVEAIVPYGLYDRLTLENGIGWAKDFAGRMAVNHEIDEEYFEHGGQIWVLKDSLYLLAMHEEIVIEVRNSEIQNLVLEMFRFIQHNSRKFDVNQRLRDLIEKSKEK